MADVPTALRTAIVTIKILGVGGGGNNLLKSIAQNQPAGVELIAINTDAVHLSQLEPYGIKTLQIGEQITRGRGAGNVVDIGAAAARADRASIQDAVQGADLVFIVAGMGAGTGTGAAPVVAEIVREMGILAIGVVTVPFSFEGKRKQQTALLGVEKLQELMDAVLVINNDNLQKLPENRKLSLINAFQAVDRVLLQAIGCVTELILTTGLINVDFADVRYILRKSESSDALFGIGRSRLNAVQAVKAALESPLLDKSINGATGVVLNIKADSSLPIWDVQSASQYIESNTNVDVDIVLGIVTDEELNGEIIATVIATSFVDSLGIPPMPKIKMGSLQNFKTQSKAAPDAAPLSSTGETNAKQAMESQQEEKRAIDIPSFMQRQKAGQEPKRTPNNFGGFAPLPSFRRSTDDDKHK